MAGRKVMRIQTYHFRNENYHFFSIIPYLLLYLLSTVYASSADIDVVDEAGSIYNGDENHKVWLGSQDRLNDIATESPYDFYSGNGNGMSNGNSSTLGRNARARQISAPIPVPPPPEIKKEKKQKKSKQQSSSQSLSGTLRPKSGHYTNGGTLVRQPHQNGNGVPMHHHQMHHQMHQMHHQIHPNYGPIPIHAHSQALPPSRFHTFSHRMTHSNSVPHLHMIQMPPMQMPVMPQQYAQQYATLQNPRNLKSKKKNKMKIPLGIPVPPPMFAYPPHSNISPQSMIHEPNRPLAMSNRKLAQSVGAGLDSPGEEEDSPGGTGIYRRKGHLNERAFSYSVSMIHQIYNAIRF